MGNSTIHGGCRGGKFTVDVEVSNPHSFRMGTELEVKVDDPLSKIVETTIVETTDPLSKRVEESTSPLGKRVRRASSKYDDLEIKPAKQISVSISAIVSLYPRLSNVTFIDTLGITIGPISVWWH